MKVIARILVGLGASLALSQAFVSPALAAKPEVDKLSPTVVRDLHFGDALFYYYQGKDLDAITHPAIGEELWNVPKFVVAFGMIVLLLEEDSRAAEMAREREKRMKIQLQRFADVGKPNF